MTSRFYKSLPAFEFRNLSKMPHRLRSRSEQSVKQIDMTKPYTQKILEKKLEAFSAPSSTLKERVKTSRENRRALETMTDPKMHGFFTVYREHDPTIHSSHVKVGQDEGKSGAHLTAQHEAFHDSMHHIQQHYGKHARTAVLNHLSSFFHPHDFKAIYFGNPSRGSNESDRFEETAAYMMGAHSHPGIRNFLKNKAGGTNIKRIGHAASKASSWAKNLKDEDLVNLQKQYPKKTISYSDHIKHYNRREQTETINRCVAGCLKNRLTKGNMKKLDTKTGAEMHEDWVKHNMGKNIVRFGMTGRLLGGKKKAGDAKMGPNPKTTTGYAGKVKLPSMAERIASFKQSKQKEIAQRTAQMMMPRIKERRAQYQGKK